MLPLWLHRLEPFHSDIYLDRHRFHCFPFDMFDVLFIFKEMNLMPSLG